MSELDNAIARLELAVARLEAASLAVPHVSDDDHVSAVAASIAARIDVALARLEKLLGREE